MKFKVKRTINEAVSPSLPNWLKPAVFNSFINGRVDDRNPVRSSTYSYIDANEPDKHYNRMGDWQERQKKAQQYAEKGYNTDSRLAQGRRFYGNQINWKNRNLTNVLNNSDINFANADFKTGEIPKKSTDEKLNDSRYQCFFLIEKDGEQQIYAPGLNDKELTIIDPSKTFKYLSYAKIKPYIKEFCYVDLQEPTSTKSAIRSNRPERLPNEERRYKTNGRRIPNRSNMDKSGYLRDPDKYKKILAKNRAGNYSQLLQNLYDSLSKYKDILPEAIKKSNLSGDELRVMNSATGYLYQGIDYYNRVLSDVESIENSFMSKDEKLEGISSLFDITDGPSYNYREALDYVERLKNILDKYEPIYLDW